ncbi:hypothetical protein O3G_MSEX011644 [Manduca sexta]|uniref:C2H2-type domain-containing protein n=1 Tax=Manduca sexta TaxID=7130 RepID=A0A922CUF0_MANSE|nr:hypothetical protein O3G_MSEX011644 [Manduca sexta]
MVAKIPGRLKTRRPTCKCEVCGCSFHSIQALRSHQACVHPRSSRRVAYKPKIEVIARRKLVPLKKTMKPANTNVKLAKTIEKPVSSVKSDDSKPYNTRRTEFECPVCTKIFRVYFSAYRHIQKNHCINDDGESVAANSPDLIQPTRIELCMSCNMRVATNLPHTCNTESTTTNYTCLGCEKTFSSLHTFQTHIQDQHSDETEKYMFPDMATYTAWKEDMESQTKIKYVELSKQDSNRFYHCEHMTKDEKTTHSCPSSLSMQEISKEVRVSFYEEHFGHDLGLYKIPEMYKKYLISLDDSEIEADTKSKDTADVYDEFKQVMNNIIVSSKRIDVNDLNTLLSKALEMSSILKKYEEHVPDVNKSITDDEISKLLDKPLRKRKIDVEDSIAKRLRKDKDAVSQKPEPDQKKEEKPQVKELKTYTNPKNLLLPKEEDKKEVQSPSSFNESYKNFVDASYKIMDKPKPKPKVDMKKKEIVKTKVGQFKPLSPKETKVVHVKPNILNREKSVHNESPKTNKSVQFEVSPKEKPKETKTVQVKPNIIQKDSKMQIKVKDYISDWNFTKIKPDFDYEVKEQENDCNILIIKI